jgi:hypothetical protein
MGAAREIGCRIDDALEAAEREALLMEGANSGVLLAQKKVEALYAEVDSDLDKETYGLDTAKVAKRYITRAAAVLGTVAAQYANRRLIAQGKVEMGGTAVRVVKKLFDEEVARARTVDSSTERQGPPNLKAARRAEVAAEQVGDAKDAG